MSLCSDRADFGYFLNPRAEERGLRHHEGGGDTKPGSE